MEYLVKNLTRFCQKSKKIHFWKKKISKMLVEMDFIPFTSQRSLLCICFLLFCQTDQPTVAGDILAAL